MLKMPLGLLNYITCNLVNFIDFGNYYYILWYKHKISIVEFNDVFKELVFYKGDTTDYELTVSWDFLSDLIPITFMLNKEGKENEVVFKCNNDDIVTAFNLNSNVLNMKY